MITLQTGAAIAGVAANANAVGWTMVGMELLSGNEAYKVLGQGNMATSAANLYTAAANTTTFVKRMFLVNQTATLQSGVIMYLSATGAAMNAATQMTGNFSIPVNGSVVYDENGWTVYDANMTTSISGPTTGRLKSVQVLAPGNTNYIVPAGVNTIYVECVGPGGGGGGANGIAAANSSFGSGGGAGGYCAKLITSLAANYACVVGAGGAGGSATGAANGSPGSANTTFTIPAGAVLTASLGTGGNFQANAATVTYIGSGGPGGAAANGDVNITGEAGFGSIRASNIAGMSGFGGASILGGGGVGQGGGANGTAVAGGAATGYGAGGGAASACGVSGAAGGNGSAGLIRVFEYA